MILFLTSCKSIQNNRSLSDKIFNYHIGVVDNFIKSEYIDDDTSLRRSIEFLERITKIKSDYSDQYVMFCNPTKNNLKDWKRWYKKNKNKLYWNEIEQRLELK